jgi:hypothetical protein
MKLHLILWGYHTWPLLSVASQRQNHCIEPIFWATHGFQTTHNLISGGHNVFDMHYMGYLSLCSLKMPQRSILFVSNILSSASFFWHFRQAKMCTLAFLVSSHTLLHIQLYVKPCLLVKLSLTFGWPKLALASFASFTRTDLCKLPKVHPYLLIWALPWCP